MKAKKIFILIIAALMMFLASSCNGNESANEEYNGDWHYDSVYHWRDPDENGDNWKSKHNFVNDVCYLCGYSRKTGTVDPSVKDPTDSTDSSSSGEGEPDIDDSKPSHDEFGVGETVFGEDGYSYTEIYGNGETMTYSVGVGNNKGKKEVDIPAEYNGIPVTAISDYGFKGETALQTLSIPNSITVIGYEAFAHCSSLQKVVIPESVTFIDHRAFLSCSKLSELTFSTKNLTNLYARTFYMCTSLKEVTLPEGLEYVAKSCFSRCMSLSTLYIPSSIKILDGESFFICPITKVVANSLDEWMNIDFSGPIIAKNGDLYIKEANGEEKLVTEVNVPSTVKKIRKCVFTNCSSLTKVTIPDTVTEIGIRAFEGCNSLKEITANGVTTVEGQTFQGMKNLEKAYLKGAVTLEREVFYNCPKFKEVHLGAGLRSIGQRCFVDTVLKDIYFDGTEADWKSIGKYGNSKSAGDCWNYNLGDYTIHLKDNKTITEKGAVYNW